MFSALVELFQLAGFVLFRGGWIILVPALVYMFYKLYLDYIQIRWYFTLDWVFLKVAAPKENEKSPLAFEHIFAQLHAIHTHLSFAEIYLEGRFQIWFTWEVTSIGGVIGNYIKILKRHRDTFEAAIYSQFPEAEIEEAEDYFMKLPRYDPETSDYDVFGFSFYLIKDDAYPIKTYYDFEHSETETIVDPITGMWEELGKLSPYEMYVVQYVLRPVDNEWKKAGYQLVKKLKGEPDALKQPESALAKVMGKVFGPLLDALIRPTAHEKSYKQEPLPSLMLHLSEGEKNVISAIERNLSKWGYQTKIHCLYIAPKEKYNFQPPTTAVVGAFKVFGANELNSLKPLLKRWTKVDYWLFKTLEKPVVDFRIKWRKRKYMNFMRRRFYFHGPPPVVLNIEELASILHFPQTVVTVPRIEKVQVTKVQPPPDLPVV